MLAAPGAATYVGVEGFNVKPPAFERAAELIVNVLSFTVPAKFASPPLTVTEYVPAPVATAASEQLANEMLSAVPAEAVTTGDVSEAK